MIVTQQIKAARMLLGWPQWYLAEQAGVSTPTVARLEMVAGPLGGYPSTQKKIIAALEAAGIEFLDEGAASPSGGAGVRLKG